MNYNISVRNNQAFSKEYLSVASMLGGSTPAMFLPEHRSGYTPLRLKMINFVIRSLNINKVSFPSQSTIAKAVGCNREAVNRAFKFFEEQGIFIVKSGKKRYRTNIYSLGAVLCNPQVRWALRYVCTGLTRAYHRIASDLNDMVKKSIVEPKRTLLYKINVLKELNTSVCSYRKRRDCKDVCFKQHREDRLYSKPYMPKNIWLNMKKSMWADWSITEEDYIKGFQMNIQHLDQDLLFDEEAQEDIRKDRRYQQFKKNDAKYPNLYRELKEYNNPQQPKPVVISHNEGKISHAVMTDRIAICKKESSLDRRIAMFERLKTQVERGSIPFINYHITETKKKLIV